MQSPRITEVAFSLLGSEGTTDDLVLAIARAKIWMRVSRGDILSVRVLPRAHSAKPTPERSCNHR